MISALRSATGLPGKKRPMLSFSAGREPSMPTPVKQISRKSGLKTTVLPDRANGMRSPKAMMTQPLLPSNSTGVFGSKQSPLPLRISALMRING